MHVAQYKELFLREATEKLKAIEDMLVALEQAPHQVSHIDSVLILTHSLKGDASTMSYNEIATALHQMEQFLIDVKRTKSAIIPTDIDHFFILVDAMRNCLSSIRASDTETDLSPALAFLVRRDTEQASARQPRKRESAKPHEDDAYRPFGSYIEVPTPDLDSLVDTVNEAIVQNVRMTRLIQSNDRGALTVAAHNQATALSVARQRLVDMQLMPVAQYFVYLSRLVRDVSREGRKFISLDFQHRGLRLERRILESLRDACTQLVRNAVTHGFNAGEKGKVLVGFEFNAGSIIMTVRDSGHGVQWDVLVKHALSLKMTTKKELDRLRKADRERHLLSLGVSSRTTAGVSSGHGIGWPGIIAAAERLGGAIDLTSVSHGPSHGVTVTIRIPTPPTMFRALTWRWGPYHIAIPLFAIETVVQLPAGERLGASFAYKKHRLPVVALSRIVGVPLSRGFLPDAVAILHSDDWRGALPLPAGAREQEVILERHPALDRLPMIAGVSLSERGAPLTIVNVSALAQRHG